MFVTLVSSTMSLQIFSVFAFFWAVRADNARYNFYIDSPFELLHGDHVISKILIDNAQKNLLKTLVFSLFSIDCHEDCKFSYCFEFF